MQHKTFTVPHISCGHCTMRVEKTLNALAGVTFAGADVDTKIVTLEWDDSTLTWDAIAAALNDIGYPPEG